MSFPEKVIEEITKEVNLPNDLLELLFLLLVREERNKFPSKYDFIKILKEIKRVPTLCSSEIPESSYSDIYAFVLTVIFLKINMSSPYGIRMSFSSALGISSTGFWRELLDFYVPVRFSQKFRRRHTYILGDTGSGKTQLIQQMILDDLETNASIIVIDSQGDLLNKLKHSRNVDPERLVIIDPVDSVYHPLALNMFDIGDRSDLNPVDLERHINGVVELLGFVFSAVMDSAFTDKQRTLLNPLLRLLLHIPDATLETFIDILRNGVGEYLEYVHQLSFASRQFLTSPEMEKSGASGFKDTRVQISWRMSNLLENPTISRLFKSTRNRFDISKEMNAGKVILISTDRSLLKRQGCAFFGRYFISLIAQAMQDRLNSPEHHRRKCYLYIDECGDYLETHDVNITDILEKGRKYNVAITLAHQQTKLLPVEVFESIRANTAIKFVGSCSASDARKLKDDMNSDYLGRQSFPYFTCRLGKTNPIYIKVRPGLLEDTEQRTEEELETIMVKNREKYCFEPVVLQKVAEPGIEEKSDEPSGIPEDPLAPYT